MTRSRVLGAILLAILSAILAWFAREHRPFDGMWPPFVFVAVYAFILALALGIGAMVRP